VGSHPALGAAGATLTVRHHLAGGPYAGVALGVLDLDTEVRHGRGLVSGDVRPVGPQVGSYVQQRC